MNNLFRHRRILLPTHCFDHEKPLEGHIRAYLDKSYPEVKLVKIEGKYAICEGR